MLKAILTILAAMLHCLSAVGNVKSRPGGTSQALSPVSHAARTMSFLPLSNQAVQRLLRWHLGRSSRQQALTAANAHFNRHVLSKVMTRDDYCAAFSSSLLGWVGFCR